MASVQVQIPANIPRSNQTISDNTLRIGLCYAGWLTLFFAAGWISKLLIPQVKALKSKEQMFWQLAIVRGVCGLLSLWAVYLFYVDKRLAVDYVFATTDESWTFVCVFLAFFIFEEVTLIYFDMKYGTFSKELHLHHFVSFVGFFTAAYYNNGHYFSAKIAVLEASTPFSCICWCLLKLKLENTKTWKINQWILIYVFHLRTVHELWTFYDIYQDWNNIKQNLPLVYTLNLCFGLGIVTFWLTPYWTYKKTVQFYQPTDWNAEVKGKKKDEVDKTS